MIYDKAAHKPNHIPVFEAPVGIESNYEYARELIRRIHGIPDMDVYDEGLGCTFNEEFDRVMARENRYAKLREKYQ